MQVTLKKRRRGCISLALKIHFWYDVTNKPSTNKNHSINIPGQDDKSQPIKGQKKKLHMGQSVNNDDSIEKEEFS